MNRLGKYASSFMKLPTRPAVRRGYVLSLALLSVFLLCRMDWSRLAGVAIAPGWLAVAALSLVAHLFLYAEIWRRLTLWAGVSLPPSESRRAWLQSLAGKYIPAKLGMIVQRAVFYNRRWPGKTDVIGGCMAAEWILAVAAGVALTLPQSFLYPGVFPEYLFYPGLATAIALLAIVPASGSNRRINALVVKFFRRPLNIPAVFGAYALGWIINGFCFYATVRAVGADAIEPMACMCIYIFSGVAGNIAIFAPAGIGVRDSLLFLGLKGHMSGELAFAAMALSRAVCLTADFSLSGLAFAHGRLVGSDAPPPGENGDAARMAHTRHPAEKVVSDNLCVGCGFCVATADRDELSMRFDPGQGGYRPRRKRDAEPAQPPDWFACPGRSLDLPRLVARKFAGQTIDPIVGPCRKVLVGHACAEEIRRNGASGGVATALLNRLFASGMIDAAYATDPGETPYQARGTVVFTPEEARRCQGSIYPPVRHGDELRKLFHSGQRFAFVGLPCQIAAMEMTRVRKPDLVKGCVFSIGLICGGLNSMKAWEWHLARFGFSFSALRSFRRNGPWPSRFNFMDGDGGRGSISTLAGQPLHMKFVTLTATQGPWMHARCRMCPDLLGDVADISLGDPHLARYASKPSAGFSLMLVRSGMAEKLTGDMLASGDLAVDEEGNADLVMQAQKFSLDNRRHIGAWLETAQWLGMRIPAIRPYPETGFDGRWHHYIWALCDMGKIRFRRLYTGFGRLMPLLTVLELTFLTYLPLWALLRKLTPSNGYGRHARFRFDSRNYENLLSTAADKGWRILSVIDWIKAGHGDRIIVLRHDVDRRPEKAARYADILHRIGVRGSFYFRKSRNGFPERWIRMVSDLGHEVGYHYETLSRSGGDREKALRMFRDDVSAFRKIAPCETVCAHGSPLSKHDNSLLLRIGDWENVGLTGEAVRSMTGHGFAYLTDTGGRWNDGRSPFNIRDRLPGSTADDIPVDNEGWSAMLEKGTGKLYLTIHPERWGVGILDCAYCRAFDCMANQIKRMIKKLRRRSASENSIQRKGDDHHL